MRAARCPDCRKLVRDKPILGTLHVCLSPTELRDLHWRRADARNRIAMQRRAIAEGSGGLSQFNVLKET